MAVSEQTPYQEFIANGTTTVFPLNFDAKEQDHLIVLVDDVEPQVGEWSFDFNTDQVTFLKAPKANSVIKIRRDTPLKRDGSYKTYDNSFRPEPVNDDLDSIWYKLQEMVVLNLMIDNDIKDLGAYVDSLNDETKAAFLAMIEKQGVSMQQLDLYVQGLYKKLAGVAIEKGWLAEFIAYGDMTQKEFNENQEEINLKQSEEVNTLGSYIVYAEKYGNSLNEAMDAINKEFVGKRVRVYVPSDFPITNTVNINVDCDLDMKSLQVKNNVDIVFNPKLGWNGSATKCDIFCNHFSVRKGWDFLKEIGFVTIDQNSFYHIGNEELSTSADYFVGFHLSNHSIKKIDIYRPTVIDSYVKPNGIVGDKTGVNRCVEIEGYVNTGMATSEINIYDMYVKDLRTNEDSDGLVINCGKGNQTNLDLNIDIYNGYFENVHRRAIKVIGDQTNATGIRFHGSIRATGGGINAWNGIDISGLCQVQWDAKAYLYNWVQGVNVWGGAYVIGNGSFYCKQPETQIINGNSTRGFVCDQGLTPSSRICIVDIDTIEVSDGYESIRVKDGQLLRLKKLSVSAIKRVMTVASSSIQIEKLVINFRNSQSVAITYDDNIINLSALTKDSYINNIEANFNQSTAINYMLWLQQTTNFKVEGTTVTGKLSTSALRLSNCKDTKLRKGSTSSQYFVAADNGGENLLLDQCQKGTVDLIANSQSAPLANVVELNTLTF